MSENAGIDPATDPDKDDATMVAEDPAQPDQRDQRDDEVVGPEP